MTTRRNFLKTAGVAGAAGAVAGAAHGKFGPAPVASAQAQPVVPQEMTREDAERRQSVWWYLLLTGLLLMALETVISNHLSRKEKFL